MNVLVVGDTNLVMIFVDVTLGNIDLFLMTNGISFQCVAIVTNNQESVLALEINY